MEVLKQTFREAWDLGCRRLNLTGGEPLLREDLVDIVRVAGAMGFFVSIATCGAQARENLEALRLCDQVMLSFDGPFEIRAELCGQQAAEASESAVELLKQHEIPFWTTSVLTRVNIPHINWIVDHAHRHGAQANFVLFHTQTGDGLRFHPAAKDVADLLPTDEAYRGAIRHLLKLKLSGSPIGSSTPCLEEWLAWPDYRQICSSKPSRLYRYCVTVRAGCELLADGRLYSCDWAFRHTPSVSVLEGGFAEAFRELPTNAGCRSCVASCLLESNLIFSLNPRAIWNWMRRIT